MSFFFAECLPEDGRKRMKSVGGLPHIVHYCVQYSAAVGMYMVVASGIYAQFGIAVFTFAKKKKTS